MTFEEHPMRAIVKTLGLVLMLLTPLAQAAEQAVDAVGYGANRTLAIADALVQGLRQVTGVSVESREVMQSISGRQSVSEGDGASHTSSFEVARQGDLKLTSGGVVSRYDVHDVAQEPDGSYRADITLHVLKYDKPGLPADSRRSLAVLPFHVDRGSFSLLGDNTPAAKVESELRNRILDLFTQSRRLNVLDREFGAEFQQEKAIWVGDDAALAEKAKAGNVLGADYIVVGNLRALRSTRNVKTLQLTGETITSYSGTAQLDYKIILAATRQVKWSDSVSINFGDAGIRGLLSKYGSSQAGMTAELAERLVDGALSNIYPMRIVAIKGKTVVLNQGGKTLKAGDKLSVYFLGEEMFDPYTKESLGQMEDKVADIQVVRVNAKTTYAKIVGGDAELVETGAIVRR
jgi:curli biogenesis system outer membrane secretion channel CsgG